MSNHGIGTCGIYKVGFFFVFFEEFILTDDSKKK